MKKYFIGILTALTLCLCLLSVSASAATVASDSCGTNLKWELTDDGTLTISGTGKMADYPYNTDAPWYYNRFDVKSIVIGDNVTTIGENAFWMFNKLTSVELGESVESIGYQAFYYCEKLTSVVIPDSVNASSNMVLSGSSCSVISGITHPCSRQT